MSTQCHPEHPAGRSTVSSSVFHLVVAGLMWLAVLPCAVHAATYYCDPLRGNTTTGDGSSANPWGTLQSVTQANKFATTILDGDHIKLRTGFHGRFSWVDMPVAKSKQRANYVYIEADEGATPDISNMNLVTASYWSFKGIRFSPSLATPSLVSWYDTTDGRVDNVPPIVYSYQGHHFIFEDCQFFTVADASGWTKDDWTHYAWQTWKGNCNYTTFRNCTFKNVHDGPRVLSYSLIEGCVIDGYCNNGMWFSGPDSICQDNQIINAYGNAAGWHMDTIQGGQTATFTNIIIRRNYCNVSTDGHAPPGLQGFFIEGYDITGVIENNVLVSTNTTHGMTFSENLAGYEAHDLKIVNNTVLYPAAGFAGNHPAINLRAPSNRNVIIRNNIADVWDSSNLADGLEVDHNFNPEKCNPQIEFVNYQAGDMRLAVGSRFIDAGTSTNAPSNDLDRNSRFAGSNVDLGAYEYGAGGWGNRPPVLDLIGNRSVTVGEQLTFSVHASDPEADPFTFYVMGLPAGATFSNQAFTWTPTQAGTYQVTFVVHELDDANVQDSEVVTITVYRPNTAPILGAIGSQATNENELLSFSVNATDADGDPLTYAAAGLPNGASLTGQTFSWTPAYDQAGSYEVTFTAGDGLAQDSQTITISVANINRSPTLAAISDRSVDEDGTLTFDLSATDPDGDALTYSATGLPSGADLLGQTFSWASAAAGSYEITFTVSDGASTDSQTCTIAVVQVGADGTAPVVARCSPTPDAIQVPLNNLISLHITDAGKGVDANSVIIVVDDHIAYQGNKDLYTSTYGQCHRSGAKNDYQFIYQRNHLFDFDLVVTVRVSAADLAGNALTEHVYSFATEMRVFGSNKVISKSTGSVDKRRPATVRDAAGNTWTAWHAGPENSRDIYVAKLAAGADAFGAPIRLTTDARDQYNPDLAVAADGLLYVVWQDNRLDQWDIYASTSTDGVKFSCEVRVTDSNDNEINPAIVVDHQAPGQAFVAWQDDRDGNQDIYVAASTNAFTSTVVSRVTVNAADQTEPDIAVDAQNAVYVVWTDRRDGSADIYAAASHVGPWTNVPVATGAGAQTDPAVAAEPDSSLLHLAWVDDSTGDRDIRYVSLDGLPGGPVAGDSVVDDTSGADQVAPAIACSAHHKAFVCWEDSRHAGTYGQDSDLYMTELSEGTGRTNVLVGDEGSNANQSQPALGVDGHGEPYVVWVDDRSASPDIYYAATTFIDPNPLDAEMVVASVGATIGTEPTAIKSPEDVSIVVPPGACQTDLRVIISRIINPQISALDCLGSYDFGPSGIDFDQPVTVTVPYRVSGSGGRAKPYWYDSLTGAMSQQGITDIETIVVSSNLNALRFKTIHFTPFYLVASDAQIGTLGAGGGGCSIAPTGDGTPGHLLVPYAIIAAVMALLRQKDRKRALQDTQA